MGERCLTGSILEGAAKGSISFFNGRYLEFIFPSGVTEKTGVCEMIAK
jgi:hypothetical protein